MIDMTIKHINTVILYLRKEKVRDNATALSIIYILQYIIEKDINYTETCIDVINRLEHIFTFDEEICKNILSCLRNIKKDDLEVLIIKDTELFYQFKWILKEIKNKSETLLSNDSKDTWQRL